MKIDEGWVVLTKKKNHNNNDRILRMPPLTNLSCDDDEFYSWFFGDFYFCNIFLFINLVVFR